MEGVVIEVGTLIYRQIAPQSLQSQARPKPTNAAASFYHHRLRNKTPESDTVPALSTMLPWSAVGENVQKVRDGESCFLFLKTSCRAEMNRQTNTESVWC